MPAFISNLPTWIIILAGIVLAYLGYRYYKYKKATAYAPSIMQGKDTTITPRDNPPNG